MFKLPITTGEGEDNNKIQSLYHNICLLTIVRGNKNRFGNFLITDKTIYYSLHKVLTLYFSILAPSSFMLQFYKKSIEERVLWLDNYFSRGSFDSLLEQHFQFNTKSTSKRNGIMERDFKDQIKKPLDSDDLFPTWKSFDRRAFCYTISRNHLFIGLCVHKDDIKKLIYELALFGEIQDYSSFKMYIPDSTQMSQFRNVHPIFEKFALERDISIITKLPRALNDKYDKRAEILDNYG